MSGTRASLRNGVVWRNPGAVDAAGNPAPPVYRTRGAELTALASQIPMSRRPTGNEVGGPSSYHGSLFNVLLGDGSARSLSLNINPNTLRQLTHRADGEVSEAER